MLIPRYILLYLTIDLALRTCFIKVGQDGSEATTDCSRLKNLLTDGYCSASGEGDDLSPPHYPLFHGVKDKN